MRPIRSLLLCTPTIDRHVKRAISGNADAVVLDLESTVADSEKHVARSAVIGRQKDGSEEIVAFIDPAPGATATVTQLVDYAASKLAPYKQPSEILLMPNMPLSPAGKILKSELMVIAAQKAHAV